MREQPRFGIGLLAGCRGVASRLWVGVGRPLQAVPELRPRQSESRDDFKAGNRAASRSSPPKADRLKPKAKEAWWVTWGLPLIFLLCLSFSISNRPAKGSNDRIVRRAQCLPHGQDVVPGREFRDSELWCSGAHSRKSRDPYPGQTWLYLTPTVGSWS